MKHLVLELDFIVPEIVFGGEHCPNLAALLESSCYGVFDESLPLDRRILRRVLREGRDAGSIGRYGSLDRADRGTSLIEGEGEASNDLLTSLAGDAQQRISIDPGAAPSGDRVVAALDEGLSRLEAALRDGGDDCAVELVESGFAAWQSARGFEDEEPRDLDELAALHERLDRGLGRCFAQLDEGDQILVVAPVGLQEARAIVHPNDFLRDRGHLVCSGDDFALDVIDWSKTRAFALGGAEARIYLNVAGRDPQGIIQTSEAAAFRESLAAELAEMTTSGGEVARVEVRKPEETFDRLEGVVPDLLVVCDDHASPVRSSFASRVESKATEDLRPAPAQGGIFLLRSARADLQGEIPSVRLQDLAPTLLDAAGITPPNSMTGRSLYSGGLLGNEERDAQERRAAERRLRGLGYL